MPTSPATSATAPPAYDATLQAVLKPGGAPSCLPALAAAGAAIGDDLLCAEIARLVYRPFEVDPAAAESVRCKLAAAGLDHCTFLSCQATQALLAREPGPGGRAVLAFRGTEADVVDWLVDAAAWPTSWEGPGQVHAGFAEAFGWVRQDVQTALAAVTDQRLLLTGHSLGAALATLAACLFRPAALATFGSPRVGDAVFAAGLAGVPVRRYQNCCDMVCQVPPEAFGFEHVGACLYIDRHGRRRDGLSTEAMDADQEAARRDYFMRLTFVPGNAAVRELADHAPANYVRALWPAFTC